MYMKKAINISFTDGLISYISCKFLFGLGLVFCLLINPIVLIAQDSLETSASQKVKFAIRSGPFISNDGVNVFFEAQLDVNKNVFTVGPTFTQTYSSSFSKSFRGIKGGYKRQITEYKDIVTYIGLDYQYYNLSAVIKSGYGGSGRNLHHELNLCYGIEKN